MLITSSRNETLKNIRRLRRCKGDLALLEGPHLVEEALAAKLPLETVLVTPEFLETGAGTRLVDRLPQPPLWVAERLLRGVTDADSPQGVLAVARIERGDETALPRCVDGIYVFADGIQDPGNLGALARTAEAAGCSGLALGPGTAYPNHPRALRASAGSLLRLDVASRTSAEALERRLAEEAPRWVSLVPRGGQNLYGADLRGALVVCLGAEGAGLSDAVRERTDVSLTIPLAPSVESLNATVAAAVVLFEIRRRRSAAGASPAAPAGPLR